MVAGSNVSVSMSNKNQYGSMSGPRLFAASKDIYTEYKNQVYDEYIDYSQSVEEIISKDSEETNEDEFLTEDKKSDLFWNKAVWTGSKGLIVDLLKSTTSSNLGGLAITVVTEGAYKSILKTASTGEFDLDDFTEAFGKGTSKAFTSGIVTLGIDLLADKGSKTGKFLKDHHKIKTLAPVLDTIKEVTGSADVKTLVKNVGGWKKYMEYLDLNDPVFAQYIRDLKMSNFTNAMSSMAIGTVIDYGATVASELIGCLVTGKPINPENLKLGENFLRSTTKTICGVAGRLIGGTVGEKIGTTAGAVIAEFQVATFDGDEFWCAVAGGAQIAGAVIGGVIATFCISNPAGWVVGACILAGAAIGFAITAIIYNWDDITSAVTSFAAKAIDVLSEAGIFIKNIATATGEMIKGIAVEAYNYIEGKIESAVETFIEIKDTAIQNAVELKDTIVEGLVELKDDFVEGAVELKDTIVEGVVEIKDDFVENVTEVKEVVADAVKANPVTNFLIGWAF